MLIAQISDTHVQTGGRLLDGRFDTARAMARAVESLATQPVRPDVILFTGDLGEQATIEEYEALGGLLRPLSIPVRAVPGNHDARAPLRAALPDMVGLGTAGAKDAPLCLVDDGFPLALVGLDTTVPGQPHGALCAERLAWLGDTLTALKDRPVLLFQHHPPLDSGLWHMDSMGLLEGRRALAEIVRRHGGVQAILCGHLHRPVQGMLGGVPVRVAPSPSHQIAFDPRPGKPYRLTAEPGQYALHLWRHDQGLVSHLVPVAGAD